MQLSHMLGTLIIIYDDERNAHTIVTKQGGELLADALVPPEHARFRFTCGCWLECQDGELLNTTLLN